MKAVIMAGGFGTRLRPLTLNIPKPMVPLGGVPVMAHLVRILKKHGFAELTALLYFQAEQIKEYFKDGVSFGVKFNYVMSAADLGTAGSVKNAQKFLGERFLVISGDVATDIDLSKAIEFHKDRKAEVTIVLTRVENPIAYGVVITDEKGRITRFLEKPSWGQVFSDTVNTGIYIIEPEVLDLIPESREYDFSKDLFPLMLSAKKRLYGYVAEGYWRDIGNNEEYFQAHQDLLEGKLNLGTLGQKMACDTAKVWIGRDTMISPTAKFSGTVIIGDKVKIGPRARLFNSVIGAKSIIGREAILNRVVAWDSVSIGPHARVSESVLCKGVVVAEEATVDENAIISDNAKIGSGAQIRANVKIWPDKEVEAGAILSSSLVWGERWTKELFTESKITGIGNVEITPEFAARLGAAYGAMLGKNSTVITSRDAGRTSRMVTRALIAGLISSGVNVAELQTIPIPVLRYQLSLWQETGGIYARMSSAGGRLIDIVFFDSGGFDLPTSKTKSLERLFSREDFRRAAMEDTGKIEFPGRVIDYYRDGFLRALDIEAIRQANLKVVIDFSFGSSAEILPAILGTLDINFISINAYIDPDRLHYFEKEKQAAIKQLSTIVRSLRADAGFLIAPDAEQLLAVDETGNLVEYQALLMKVLTLYLKSSNPKKIAVPITACAGIEQIADKNGLTVERFPDNHLSMMDALHSRGADFVGGTKGGFIFPGFQVGADAMFATAKILELMAKSDKRLGQIEGPWSNLKITQKEVPCSWTKKGLVMRRLIEHTAGKTRLTIDGVRFASDGAHILIKPDRARAAFWIQIESKSPEKAKNLLKEYSDKIKEWQELPS